LKLRRKSLTSTKLLYLSINASINSYLVPSPLKGSIHHHLDMNFVPSPPQGFDTLSPWYEFLRVKHRHQFITSKKRNHQIITIFPRIRKDIRPSNNPLSLWWERQSCTTPLHLDGQRGQSWNLFIFWSRRPKMYYKVMSNVMQVYTKNQFASITYRSLSVRGFPKRTLSRCCISAIFWFSSRLVWRGTSVEFNSYQEWLYYCCLRQITVPLNFIAKATQSENKITLRHRKDTASYLVDPARHESVLA
jgi:hypothetical protein